MSTKYAKARDVAYQWRAEQRKVARENKALRDVYFAARALLQAIEAVPLQPEAAAMRLHLKSACRNAVFAEPAQTTGGTP